MYGVGYPVLENAIGGRYAIGFLLLLLAGKMVATSLTIGVGGSGGVFAPSLFMGAMFGTAFGQSIADALQLLVTAQGTGLPVLDETKIVLVGWITHQRVLTALRPAPPRTKLDACG